MTTRNKAAADRFDKAATRLNEVLDKVDEVSPELRTEIEEAFKEWIEARQEAQ